MATNPDFRDQLSVEGADFLIVGAHAGPATDRDFRPSVLPCGSPSVSAGLRHEALGREEGPVPSVPRLVADRFEIERLAGSGGMGEVYRARDLRTGNMVALKVTRDDDVGPEEAKRFDREARLLAELEHPGIVAYVAHGTASDGRLFLAMEWLDGEDLGSRLRRGPLSIGACLELGWRVSEALAAAHRKGVIHRDLKPSNLFLVGGIVSRVKLLDFGIARRMTASRVVTRTGTAMGTPDYIAPEQARGLPVLTPAADVFSLGCVLHEAMTGAPPFAAESLAAVLARILFGEPTPLEVHRPDVPADLAALLRRMIAKEPADRFADAGALLAALDALVGPPPSGGPSSSECITLPPPSLSTDDHATLRLSAGDSLSALISEEQRRRGAATIPTPESRRGATTQAIRDPLTFVEGSRLLLGKPSPCVGREREIAALEALFHGCVDEEVARAAVITAPAGTGKSRLLHEICVRIGDRAGAVWVARGDPMSAGSPFGMLSQIVRRGAGIDEAISAPARSERLRAWVRRRIDPPRAERIADLLGEIAGTAGSSPPSPEIEAARRDPLTLGELVRAASVELLSAECAAGPVVVVLEDLHWGDVATVKAMDAALRALRERPLFVLAAARPAVREVFPRLWAGRALTDMELGELPRRASERLVRTMLGEATPKTVVERLVSLSSGNAFYLEELIRAVAEGRDTDLPESVLAMVDARLDALDPDAQRLLSVASVFGEVFWGGGVEHLFGASQSAARLRVLVGDLLEQEVIERRSGPRFSAHDEVCFRHGLLREAAYRRLTDAERALGHRLAGEWLEGVGETDASVLAEHFDQGGAKHRAGPYFLRAGQDAIAGCSFERGIEMARRGEAAGATGADLGLLRLVETEARTLRFELQACTASGTEAMALLEEGSGPWFGAAGAVAMASAALGQRERAGSLLLSLSSVEPRPGALPSAMMGLCWSVMTLSCSGMYPAAAGILERAEALAARYAPDDPAVAAFVLQSRAWVGCTEDDPWRRLSLARIAARARDEAPYSGFAARAYADLGEALQAIGAHDDADLTLARALELAESTGMAYATVAVTLFQGLTALGRGRSALAEPLFMAALERCRSAGERYYGGRAAVNLARCLAQRGELAAAEREARAVFEARQARPLTAYAGAVLASILLTMGRREEALTAAREGKRLFDALGAVHEGDALIHLTWAETLHAVSHPTADEALASAGARLRDRAAKIEDATLRCSFLESVPDHRETLARLSRDTDIP